MSIGLMGLLYTLVGDENAFKNKGSARRKGYSPKYYN
jgi:hypothetical protein